MSKKMQVVRDFKHLEAYTKLIESKINTVFWDLIFKPLFTIVNIKAENDSNVIADALRKGDIFYQDGGFKARKKFSNAVSVELIKLGAKYDKYQKKYLVLLNLLPDYITQIIEKDLLGAQTKLQQINEFLYYVQLNMDQIIESFVFDDELETILDSVEGQTKENFKKINVIVPELSEKQIEEIKTDYNYNMQFYIKKWTVNRIENMRVSVSKMVLEGARASEVQEMLEKEYKVKGNKAKFLAQNETAIMLSSLKKSMYKEMGFTEFIWQTILDGVERPLHRQLHGKIFSFDNPPVIDERTGQTGLPAQTYNCRCNLIPIRRESAFLTETQKMAFAEFDERIMKYGPNE